MLLKITTFSDSDIKYLEERLLNRLSAEFNGDEWMSISIVRPYGDPNQTNQTSMIY